MPDGSLTFDTRVDESSFTQAMDNLTAAVKEGLETISAKMDALATLLNDRFTEAMGGVRDEVTDAMDSVQTSVSGGISQAGAATKKAMEDEADEAADGLDDVSADVGSRSIAVGAAVGTMLGNMAGNLISGAISNAGQYIMDSIDLASDLAEVQNVVNTTFEENTGEIDGWAKAAKTAYGMSELKAKRYTSTMGAMLKSMKLGDKQVLSMSEGVAGLAGDMASFYNLEHDEAFEKIKSGIAGETEGLKSLGINMSAANLEAFALSEGITKSYASMTQAEQATLRYNYLMQATADAQGDFAKTSDGYANQQRILDTTLEELSATVGSLFLPAATAVVGILNTLAGGARDVASAIAGMFSPPEQDPLTTAIEDGKKAFSDLEQQIKDSDTTFANNKAEIQARYDLATQYLNTLSALEQKDVKTDQDVEAMKAATAALVDLYPDLKANLDPVTGLFAAGSAAIRDFVSNLNALAVKELYSDKMKENATLLATAYSNLTQSEQNLTDATNANHTAQAKLNALSAAQYAFNTHNVESIDEATAAYLCQIPNVMAYFEVMDNGRLKVREGKDEQEAYNYALEALADPAKQAADAVSDTQLAMDGASATINGLNHEIDGLNSQNQALVTEQQKVLDSMNGTAPAAEKAAETVRGLGDRTAEAADSLQSAGGTIADAMERIRLAKGEATEAQTEQQKAIDKNAELAELTATIASNIETASKAGTDAVATLTAAKATIAADAQEAITNMESLTTALGLYVQAMVDTLNAIVTDGEVGAATAGEAFAKGAGDGYRAKPYLKDAVNTAMNQALATLRSYFNAFENAGYGIVDHMASGVRSGQSALTSAISAVIRSAISTAQANAAYRSTTAGVVINGSHAGGLERVPFDGYIAELHRNEAVLNAPEAAVWRALQGENTSAGLDASGIIQAIRESGGAPIYVTLSIDGEDLTEILEPKISERQGQRLRLKGR